MAPKKGGKKGGAQPKTFDEGALASLTAKIENKLGGQADTVYSKKEAMPNHDQGAGKRKRQDGPAPDGAKGPKAKKRHTDDAEKPAKPAKQTKTSSATLLEEIRALGGDEDDLELVANLDSDAEEGGSMPKPKDSDDVDDAFKSELAKFAASLGLENLRPEDEGEEEEEEEEEAPEEDEEADDDEEVPELAEEEEEEEEEPEPVQPAPTTREERKRDRLNGNLVSKAPGAHNQGPASANTFAAN
jgi:ribosome biogenesis protein MAK21